MKNNEYIEQMKKVSPSEDLIQKTIHNINQVNNVQKVNKTNYVKKILLSATAMVTLSVGTVGAYVAISKNTEILQKIGINIANNYDINKQEIENNNEFITLADGVQIKLNSISVDNTNLILEIDAKLDDEEIINPDFSINDIQIYWPEKNFTEKSAEAFTFSEKHSSQKLEDGTWRIFKYIAIQHNIMAGNSYWINVFDTENSVKCKLELQGLKNNEKEVTKFLNNNKVLEFEINKPENLKDTEITDKEITTKFNNISIKFFQIQKSNFGNTISFIAEENNIDVDKINDIQKIKFIIKNSAGEIVNVVSRTENITFDKYNEGKFCTIGVELQLTVDEVSEDNDYTIEMVESDTVLISKDKIKKIHDEMIEDLKKGEIVIDSDGTYLIREYENVNDYYMDEYGVYRMKEDLDG